MKTIILLLSYILLISFYGCSQKYGISKSHAYTRKITAGNIPVDHNNRPTTSGVQTVHIIYIETAPMQEPVWDTAWVEGKPFSIQMLKIPGNKATIGKTKDEQKEVMVQAAAGNMLWQLLLTPISSSTKSLTSKKAPILLRGKWKGKRVMYEIKKHTELATIFAE
jgi:hypothetical protein